jgi:hypothetical protein
VPAPEAQATREAPFDLGEEFALGQPEADLEVGVREGVLDRDVLTNRLRRGLVEVGLHRARPDRVAAVVDGEREPAETGVRRLGGAAAMGDGDAGQAGTAGVAADPQTGLGLAQPAQLGPPRTVEPVPVGLLGDRCDHGVDRDLELRSGHRHGAAPTGGIGFAELHPLEHEASHGRTVAAHLHRSHEELDLDAFGDGVVDLLGDRGHLGAGPPVQHRDGRSGAAGGPCRIDGRVAPTHHGDAVSEVDPLALIDPAEVFDAGPDTGGVLTGHPEAASPLGADGHVYEVVLVSQAFERDILTDGHTEPELDAQIGDALDLCIEHVRRQAVVGDAVPQHAAGVGVAVVHDDRVAAAGHLVGEGEAGGAGADDRHGLALGLGLLDRETQVLVDSPVAEEALQGVDGDGTVEVGAVALRLARMRADPAQHGGERVDRREGLPGGPERRRVVDAELLALRDDADPAARIAAGEASGLARRRLGDLGRPEGREIHRGRLDPSCHHERAPSDGWASRSFSWSSRMRSAIVCTRLYASSGSSWMRRSNVRLSMVSTRTSPTALTVAALGTFWKRDISPKKSPAAMPPRRTSVPSRSLTTSTSPAWMTYMQSPGSPSRTMASPSVNSLPRLLSA